jgi:hypothetical protein
MAPRRVHSPGRYTSSSPAARVLSGCKSRRRAIAGTERAVNIGMICVGAGFRRGKRFDAGVVGRVHADGVGGRCISRQRKSLAAAAAPVALLAIARPAGLKHPVCPTIGHEGWRRRPDIGKRSLPHRPEFQTGNRLGRVAGQDAARRGDVHEPPSSLGVDRTTRVQPSTVRAPARAVVVS